MWTGNKNTDGGLSTANWAQSRFSFHLPHNKNESTVGADASVEALKLYHMKLTLALQ